MKNPSVLLAMVAAPLAHLLTSNVAGSTNASANTRPMDQLNWLVGDWTFEDIQINGQYWERGTRSCVRVLDEQYIRCESRGISNTGHERSYYFIVGYNEVDRRYEMIGLTSSYPRQNLYTIKLSDDGFKLELKNHFWTADGIVPSNDATISYNGRDEYIWEIRNGEPDPITGERAVGFVDTVRRAN